MTQYVLVPRDTLQAHYNTLEAYCGYTDEEVTELRNLLVAPCEPVGQLQEDAFGRGQVMWNKKPDDLTQLYAPQKE